MCGCDATVALLKLKQEREGATCHQQEHRDRTKGMKGPGDHVPVSPEHDHVQQCYQLLQLLESFEAAYS